MDLLGGYSSKSEDENDSDTEVKQEKASLKPAPNLPAKAKPADRRFLKAAPAVSIMTRRKHGSELIVIRNENSTDSTALILEPIQGPQAMDPAHAARQPAGKTEKGIQFDHAKFAKQRTAFQNTGRAIGPDDTNDATGAGVVVRSTLGYNRDRLQLLRDKEERRCKRPRVINDKNETLVYGSDDEAEHGIWAPPTKEERWHSENRTSDLAKAGGNLDDLAPEQRAEREYLAERDRQRGIAEEAKEDESAFDRLVERKMSHLLPPKLDKDAQPADATTTFHGKDEYDYKGKSWMAPPPGLASIISGDALEMDHHKCFVPQKCAHRFSGHGKGVHRIRLFPKTGHLLLSAGLDGKCKVWSVATRQLMRTYEGHSAAVRDVQFNHDGSRFVSASFDRYLRMWDTESGKVVQTFGNRKVPYVIQFYPHDDNLFVVGCSDNKIVTYDATTGEVTQEYNHHLAPVNAIVFVEDHGTKMVSTSDDRKVLVWEWDIGVPIKYISDPTMHSMPCLTMHPSLQYFCAQSLDNHIAVFQAGNRFTLQKKKKFTGHLVAGYACDMAISPDGQYLASGDGNGKLWFWEWKRHK
jgi:pre-mRNA-processing factor 17